MTQSEERADAFQVTRRPALQLVEAMIQDGTLRVSDLRPLVPPETDEFDPAHVTFEHERWFRSLGVEFVTGRKFELTECPFTADEIGDGQSRGEVLVVSPRGLSACEVGRLCHVDTWAFSDPLVSETVEEEDMWFFTSADPEPLYSNKTHREVRRILEDNNQLGMSLQRYMLFIARITHLTGRTPDQRWWVWMHRGRYDRSGALVAGFDANRNFSVHGWLPHFQASFVGSRPIRIPDAIAKPV